MLNADGKEGEGVICGAERVGAELMFVLTKNVFWYNFVMDVLLIGFQMFEIKNCVILRFRNTEMYSRIYVASYQRK